MLALSRHDVVAMLVESHRLLEEDNAIAFELGGALADSGTKGVSDVTMFDVCRCMQPE